MHHDKALYKFTLLYATLLYYINYLEFYSCFRTNVDSRQFHISRHNETRTEATSLV